jgi:two-component system, NarL family, captular synthesis response regulator RcsB
MTEHIDLAPPIRTLIADDHPLVLLAVENLVSALPNVNVVARAADVDELFDEASRATLDLAVMDLYMPGAEHGAGLTHVEKFREHFPGVAVVVLTMENQAETLQRALSLGVDAVVSKRDRVDLIQLAIVSALARERYLGPAVRARIEDATRGERLREVRQILSRRELEVLTHYASGMAVTAIAAKLERSVKTISAQKCNAMKKLSLATDAELYRFAVEHGLAPAEGFKPAV